jgi:hypothetical protein
MPMIRTISAMLTLNAPGLSYQAQSEQTGNAVREDDNDGGIRREHFPFIRHPRT